MLLRAWAYGGDGCFELVLRGCSLVCMRHSSVLYRRLLLARGDLRLCGRAFCLRKAGTKSVFKVYVAQVLFSTVFPQTSRNLPQKAISQGDVTLFVVWCGRLRTFVGSFVLQCCLRRKCSETFRVVAGSSDECHNCMPLCPRVSRSDGLA